MATDMALHPMLNLSPSVLAVLALFLVIASVLTTVRLYTTICYRRALVHHTSGTDKTTRSSPPPTVPYTMPILGHAISFLAPRPGKFWEKLFRSHPRATGACTLNLGGDMIHVLFSPSAVQALFKARGPTRDGFNLKIMIKGFGLDHKECMRYFGVGEGPDHTGLTPVQQQENVHHHYMLEKKAVNGLTAEFMRVFSDQTMRESKVEGEAGR